MDAGGSGTNISEEKNSHLKTQGESKGVDCQHSTGDAVEGLNSEQPATVTDSPVEHKESSTPQKEPPSPGLILGRGAEEGSDRRDKSDAPVNLSSSHSVSVHELLDTDQLIKGVDCSGSEAESQSLLAALDLNREEPNFSNYSGPDSAASKSIPSDYFVDKLDCIEEIPSGSTPSQGITDSSTELHEYPSDDSDDFRYNQSGIASSPDASKEIFVNFSRGIYEIPSHPIGSDETGMSRFADLSDIIESDEFKMDEGEQKAVAKALGADEKEKAVDSDGASWEERSGQGSDIQENGIKDAYTREESTSLLDDISDTHDIRPPLKLIMPNDLAGSSHEMDEFAKERHLIHAVTNSEPQQNDAPEGSSKNGDKNWEATELTATEASNKVQIEAKRRVRISKEDGSVSPVKVSTMVRKIQSKTFCWARKEKRIFLFCRGQKLKSHVSRERGLGEKNINNLNFVIFPGLRNSQFDCTSHRIG